MTRGVLDAGWPTLPNNWGRPSGIAILRDDTLIVADSESNQIIGGPPQAPEGMGADNEGNVFAGLTGTSDTSPSGGCLQKRVER